ncbi:peptidase M15 [Dysgonomonas sp. GY75]|uniref:D-Ala-D-Ala carboxypeptidase family metallohydrolase n=1 Tax=Dysgonomonas sp. GY75 TaxID=2780419 RepID=UPI001883FBB2|nr:D-Ala-D-Ala carboxypeptidase family metallohydrolase [Dysgonomonas sp. GY75]MBF0651298.1 peptidase M15 [Dysgonomonas sp. GY75]
MATHITKNFTLEELSHSNTAVAKGIENTPDVQQQLNLTALAKRLLQPLRDIYNEPFIINSGFRSQETNKAVGGVPNSQHTKGQAADVQVKDPRKLLAALLGSGLDFDQAILYQDGRNNFLHMSYNSGHNRKQVLYSKGTRP